MAGRSLTRRSVLLSPLAPGLAAAPDRRKRVAAVVTTWFPNSHADVFVGMLLNGCAPNGVPRKPRTRVVSLYTDQIAREDRSRAVAAGHGIPIYPTIAEALTLGGSRLAVDAVLFVGEHGDYPTNELGQKLYPRYELFLQIAEVLRRAGRSVPVYYDKHFSYSWEKARRVYDLSRELRIPMMAGSSIPLTGRVPELELPLDCPLEHAVAAGYGEMDAYGFHTLEVLQCMVERRAGGETGVAAVETLEGDAVWRWRDSEAGRWSAPLLEAALTRAFNPKPGRPEQNARRPILFLIQYRDGFRSAVYMLNGHVTDWLFSAKRKDLAEPVSTHFGFLKPERLRAHRDGLIDCIEHLFVTGWPRYPVERTLLTTGMLSFLFESLRRRARVETPELRVAYRAPRHAYFQRS